MWFSSLLHKQLSLTPASLLCCQPMVLASRKHWRLLLQLDFIFTNNLSFALFKKSNSSAYQKLAALHDPFKRSEPVPCRWVLHYTCLVDSSRYNLGHIWNISSVCWHSGNISFRFHLKDTDLFLITSTFSPPDGQYWSSQQSIFFYFCGSDIILITMTLVVSTWQKKTTHNPYQLAVLYL